MISVIVPIYNVVSYLDECVASIVAQTYKSWECILVDDGSVDGSGDICDEWAKKDERIRVVHQDNGGVSKARNRGIEESKGEYIVFVDSDDTIGKEHLRNLVGAPKADLIVAGIRHVVSDGDDVDYKPSCGKTFSFSQEGIEEIVDLNRKYLLYGPVVKLYQASIVKENGVIFPSDCSYGEDLLFNLKYLEHVHTISQVNDVSYYYRRGTETLSTRERTNQFEQDYEQWKMLKAFYASHGMWLQPMKEMLYERLWGIVYDGIFSTFANNKEILSVPEIKELKNYQHVFHCSWWIKWCILHRIAVVFR